MKTVYSVLLGLNSTSDGVGVAMTIKNVYFWLSNIYVEIAIT